MHPVAEGGGKNREALCLSVDEWSLPITRLIEWSLLPIPFLRTLPFLSTPISPLSQLVECEHLGLSSNNIERICCLGQLRNLKVLSLGRNQVRLMTRWLARAHTCTHA